MQWAGKGKGGERYISVRCTTVDEVGVWSDAYVCGTTACTAAMVSDSGGCLPHP